MTPHDTNRPKAANRETILLWAIAIISVGIITWLSHVDTSLDKDEAAAIKKQVQDYCATFPAAALCLNRKQ